MLGICKIRRDVMQLAGLPPPPYTNSKGCCCLSHVGREGTNLYNTRPQWLENAHATLDPAVAAAYGWTPSISNDNALEALLELNGRHIKDEGLVAR